MKRKRRNYVKGILLAFLAVIALGGIALTLSPPLPTQRHASSLDVPVAPPPRPPVGDEKSDNQALPPPALVPVPSLVTPQHPVIAIVIDDMGLDLKDSKHAVALPPSVTLSYMPYAPNLREQTREAWEAGHELLLHMPMEPMGHDNPGPGALLVDLPPDDIRQRFQFALASFIGFDGVNNHMGSRFTADAVGMEIVIDELQQRHLFFLDSRTSAATIGAKLALEKGLPVISRDVFLDDDVTSKAIGNQFERTERIAQTKGYAVAIGHPHELTLQSLEQWLPEAEKRGYRFVPLKQLVSH